jgi:hypothetical protein
MNKLDMTAAILTERKNVAKESAMTQPGARAKGLLNHCSGKRKISQ